MKTRLPLILIVFTIIQQITVQNTSSANLVRSTTGVSGSSSTISINNTINNKNYIIQQSIGQASVIGTFNNTEYAIRQGFTQPDVLAYYYRQKHLFRFRS
jgi:hypothetical protein